MTDSLKKEIESIIDKYKLNISVNDFEKKFNRWYFISKCHILSECFIERFQHKVNWICISLYQKLSESFIERFKNKVCWNCISKYQKLSENFIEKFNNDVNWFYISKYQKLSESFIEKHKNYVDWGNISKYQKLSEDFIEKFKDNVHWNNILFYQVLSKKLIDKYNLFINPYDNTMYMTIKRINNLIPDCYEREGDYIIAYKNVRRDRYSHHNFQYKYEKGGIYDCHCDCNNDVENSFGLSLWTKEQAEYFHMRGIVIKCRVKVEDIGAIVHRGNKLRCKRIEVLE